MMFYNCKKRCAFVLGVSLTLVFSSFYSPGLPTGFKWAEDYFKTCFDPTANNAKLKKWELSITETGFFRFKKFYLNGKQEYFSFNLKKFDDLEYFGTEAAGEIVLKTKSDDIIVQTYDDPKGNIDSMSESLKIPVVNVKLEMLDSLRLSLSGVSQ